MPRAPELFTIGYERRLPPELVAELPRGPRTALLCLEADPAAWHRRALAERLAERVPGLAIIDL